MQNWSSIASMSDSQALSYIEFSAVQVAHSLEPRNPLPSNEIRQVARSVCRWLRRKFSPTHAAQKFSAKQKIRQLKSSANRKMNTRRNLLAAIKKHQMLGVKLTITNLALITGCSRQAIYQFHPEVLTFVKQSQH